MYQKIPIFFSKTKFLRKDHRDKIVAHKISHKIVLYEISEKPRFIVYSDISDPIRFLWRFWPDLFGGIETDLSK
jgi:hypothetical protein